VLTTRVVQTTNTRQDFLPKRFITDGGVLKRIKQTKQTIVSRNSDKDTNISTLIKLIKNKKYKDADRFISDNKININSHDSGENTPLTDAAYRGDEKAIEYLLEKKGINPHASCDCPFHKTALHYAVERGHHNIVRILLKEKVNPNVLDSRNYSALDIAKDDEMINLLISNNGLKGKDVPKTQRQALNLPRTDCQHRLK